MRALIVFESMYGNTRAVADAIAGGFGDAEIKVVPVHGATRDLVDWADVVVVGGPTHIHGMSRERTRAEAIKDAAEDDDLTVDPDAEGDGVRDWFEALDRVDGVFGAAFDTRVDMNPVLTGRASKGIARRLRRHGFRLVVEPESFLVDKQTHLLAEETARARQWGEAVAAAVDREAAKR